jgi:protein-tyrosine phosphatase
MFNLFKKPLPHIDFSPLEVDMHSHLIPGVDDGSPDLETSLDLIRKMADMGYKKIITTPHVYLEYYPNDPDTILPGLEALKAAVEGEAIPIEIHAAAEYFMDEYFGELLEKKALLTLKDNYVLVELSFFGAPPDLEDLLFKMQIKGYKPIMAHPERYLYYKGDIEKYQRLKELGCLLQLNILSLTGFYDRAVRKNAWALIDEGLIDLLGTDLHNDRYAEHLALALKDRKVAKLLEEGEFRNKELFS